MSDEMRMTVMAVDPPLPVAARIAILLTFIFLFVGPSLTRRSRQPLIVLTLRGFELPAAIVFAAIAAAFFAIAYGVAKIASVLAGIAIRA